jgi:predicted PurR-regulated permease PerM
VLSQDLGRLLQNFSNTLLKGLNALLAGGAGLLQGVAGLIGGLFQLFLALIIAAYLMLDFERVGETALLVVPKPYQTFSRELAAKLDRAVGGYLRGQLLVALLAGLTLGVGYALVGVPMAPALGLIGGLFNLVPYLGGFVSLLLAVLVAATKSWVTVGLAALVFVIENQLEANVYSPMILSKTTELHPLSVIFAILLGGSLYGLWGALVAVPTAAFLKLLFYDYYLKSRFYQEG